MNGIPEWLASVLHARGICDDCHQAPAATFWQSLQGPQLCWGCADRRSAAFHAERTDARA